MKNAIYILIILTLIFACKKDNSIDKIKPNLKNSGTLDFTLVHSINGVSLSLGGNLSYHILTDTFNLTQLTYYLSNIVLTKTDSTKIYLNNYQLIDVADHGSLTFSIDKIPNGNYTNIEFLIGVDSLANSTGDHTGALDPQNGMSWAWNFGYRFWAIEGNFYRNSLIKSYSHHIGRNGNQVQILMPAIFEISNNKKYIVMGLNMDKYFSSANNMDIKSYNYTQCIDSNETAIAHKFSQNIKNVFNIISIK